MEDDQIVTALNAVTSKVGEVHTKQEVMHGDLLLMKEEQGRTNGRLGDLEELEVRRDEREKVDARWEARDASTLESKIDQGSRRAQVATGIAAIVVAGTLGAIQFFA